VQLDDSALAAALAQTRLEAQGYSTALEEENERLMKCIIEEQTGAYIQDKAAQLGVTCTVQVTCQENGEGALYPASVTVYGELSETETDTLTRLIQGDLAIPAEDQHYERTKER
jgi:stage III sporulation protein AF